MGQGKGTCTTVWGSERLKNSKRKNKFFCSFLLQKLGKEGKKIWGCRKSMDIFKLKIIAASKLTNIYKCCREFRQQNNKCWIDNK